jgi:hypothetical protein
MPSLRRAAKRPAMLLPQLVRATKINTAGQECTVSKELHRTPLTPPSTSPHTRCRHTPPPPIHTLTHMGAPCPPAARGWSSRGSGCPPRGPTGSSPTACPTRNQSTAAAQRSLVRRQTRKRPGPQQGQSRLVLPSGGVQLGPHGSTQALRGARGCCACRQPPDSRCMCPATWCRAPSSGPSGAPAAAGKRAVGGFPQQGRRCRTHYPSLVMQNG